MDLMKKFTEERNNALLSLDKEQIVKFMKKYNIPVPYNDLIFWGGVHKAILQIDGITKAQREYSEKWLLDNGYKVERADELTKDIDDDEDMKK